MKPGDLVRISDWETVGGWNPIGLVISGPQTNSRGETYVHVDWLESPDTDHYSVDYLDIISES
jgi:hypothetical protein